MDKKMKKYYLSDGGRITASSAVEFVAQLHSSSFFDSEGTHREYMRQFAERYLITTGHDIDTSSEDKFLDDLIRTGYITQYEIINES
jgi:hypothetical protein